MGGHEWAHVAADGYGLGMGTNLKENVGLCHALTWVLDVVFVSSQSALT
jgi:hypothetical protein